MNHPFCGTPNLWPPPDFENQIPDSLIRRNCAIFDSGLSALLVLPNVATRHQHRTALVSLLYFPQSKVIVDQHFSQVKLVTYSFIADASSFLFSLDS